LIFPHTLNITWRRSPIPNQNNRYPFTFFFFLLVFFIYLFNLVQILFQHLHQQNLVRSLPHPSPNFKLPRTLFPIHTKLQNHHGPRTFQPLGPFSATAAQRIAETRLGAKRSVESIEEKESERNQTRRRRNIIIIIIRSRSRIKHDGNRSVWCDDEWSSDDAHDTTSGDNNRSRCPWWDGSTQHLGWECFAHDKWWWWRWCHIG
jgi:hypothetical protein